MKKSSLLLFVSLSLLGSPWEPVLEKLNSPLISTSTREAILKEYQTFSQHHSPKIVDPCVKNITIIECNEPLVDITQANAARISIMTDEEARQAYPATEAVDPRAPTFSIVRKSVFEALLKMVDILDRIAPLFGYEQNDLEIKLFEGLRDIETQKILFEQVKAKIRAEHPTMTDDQVYAETCTYVSPYINNIPVHATGAAIDIHLKSRKTGLFLNMGKFNTGGSSAPTFSDDSLVVENETIMNNRLFLLVAATEAGLTDYHYEFWHFSLGDRYAAWFNNLPVAIYGLPKLP